MRHQRRKSTQPKTVFSRLTLESLEARRLLAGDLVAAEFGVADANRESRFHRLENTELMDRVNFQNISSISSSFYGATGEAIFMPTVVGGSATGTPADTPADRLDPNTPAGGRFAGVVSVDVLHPTLGQFICTGAMISPTAVLTAAHCFDLETPIDGAVDADVTATIYVNDGGNQTSAHAVSVINSHPDFDGFSNSGANDDLAVLQLATAVPASIPIYPIRNAGISQGELLEFVGYGQSGNGDVGFSSVDPNFFDKRVGANLAELFVEDDELGVVDEIFLFDFDENTGTDNGFLGGPTLGNDIEASVGQGDSGAPAFVDVNGQLVIAGVITFEFALSNITPPPGEFGSLGGGVISGPYVPWISSFLGPTSSDLQVSITETSDTIVAGSGPGNLQYEVEVANFGPNDATNVTLDQLFSLQPGVTIDSFSLSSGTFTEPTWSIPMIPTGSSETITFTLTVGASAPSGVNLIATNGSITGLDQSDTIALNDSLTEFTSIAPAGSGSVDIAITQTESADPVVAGSAAGNLVYTVNASNIGSAGASGLVVENALTLPAGVTLVSATPSVGSFVGTTWNIGDLAATANESLTVVVTVDAATVAGTDVINSTAFVAALNETDVNGANDVSTITTSVDAAVVTGVVDLLVTQTESADPVVAGSGTGNLTYTVNVTNLGTVNGTGIAIDELLTLPTGVTLVSATPSVGAFAGTTWTVGTLAPSTTESLTVVLTVDGATSPGVDVIQSSAFVSSLNETDANPANDGAVESTSVDPQVVSGVVDVSITQTESIDPAGFGFGNLVYTISATNAGTLPVTGVTVEEVLTLPAGVTVDSVVSSAGSFAGSTWTVGSLAVGATETLTVTVSIGTAAQQGTDVIQSAATLSGLNEVDSNPANNSSIELTSIQDLGVDVAISQTESVTTVVPGTGPGNLVYTVTAANLGSTFVGSVIINNSLTLPAGVTLDSAVVSSGLFLGDTWIINALPGGTQETLTLTLTADATAIVGDEIANVATLTFLGGVDSNGTNNMSTETTPIGAFSTDVDIAISQIESIDPVVAGSGSGNLVYTITAENNGVTPATGVSIDALLNLPAGVTLDSGVPSLGSFVNSLWSVGTLNAGASETLTLTLTVDSTAVGGTDAITSSVSLNSVNELDTDLANNTAVESTTITPASSVPQVPAAVNLSGSSWAVSGYPLAIGANPTLPWVGMNNVEIIMATAQAQPPTLILEGPTAGVAPIATSLTSWDGNIANYTLPNLTDGFYKATIDGTEYHFSVVVADMSQNGSVGFDDFSVLASVFGTTSSIPFVADVDANGTVGFGDFSFLSANFTANLNSFVAPVPPAAVVAAVATDQVFANGLLDDEDDEVELGDMIV